MEFALQTPLNKTRKNHSPDMMDPSFLAPAATQDDASLLMLPRRTIGRAAMLRNTRAFR